MPLPPAANRTLSHSRMITCHGFEREDRLWDIEGRLLDTKAQTWVNRAGLRDLPAGEQFLDQLRQALDVADRWAMLAPRPQDFAQAAE